MRRLDLLRSIVSALPGNGDQYKEGDLPDELAGAGRIRDVSDCGVPEHHIIDFTGNNPGYKWLIYMTNQVNWREMYNRVDIFCIQGILLLTLHYVLYASLVTANYLLPRGFTYTGSIPFLYK